MSKIAGDFSCASLLETQVKIDRIWADAAAQKDYIAEVGTLTALRANQTAQLTDLEETEKTRSVKVMWLTDCSGDTGDNCDDDCSVGGPELEADCKTYALDLCHKIGFTISEKVFRTNNFSKEEVLAKALMSKSKAMDEWITTTVIAILDTFSGVNVFPGIGTIVGTDTYIQAPYWTADLLAYFTEAKVLNKMRNSFMLSGHNLYQQSLLANWKSGNSDGKGDASIFSMMNLVFDLFNLDSTLGAKKTFLIERSAYAFHSKTYFNSTPETLVGAGLTRWTMPSKNLPGVNYDVTYTTRCEGNDIFYDWSLQFYGGFFQNPLPCNGQNTGILSFICGNTP